MASNVHVVVIGAGVTGLTSALFLAEAGYDVTVVAAHVPGDASIEYTSPWAGAHWRTHAKEDEPMLQGWDVQTYNYWLDLMERERMDQSLPKSGLKLYDSFNFWDGPVTESLWWAPHVLNFVQLSETRDPVRSVNERTPAGRPKISNAATNKATAVNVPQYLLYLQERGRKVGVQLIKSRLPVEGGLPIALASVESVVIAKGGRKPGVYVNATGLGAAKLCGDEDMFPIRGQTVLVKGEAEACRTRIGDGQGYYCIPRPGSGTTILGGTKQIGNWSEAVDPETTARILENCAYFTTELLTGQNGGFEVVSVQCGLRPGRKGGPRLEREVVGEKEVVHAYGHAGGGYQNSVGSARKVVQLVQEALGDPGIANRARL